MPSHNDQKEEDQKCLTESHCIQKDASKCGLLKETSIVLLFKNNKTR